MKKVFLLFVAIIAILSFSGCTYKYYGVNSCENSSRSNDVIIHTFPNCYSYTLDNDQ